MRLAVKLTMYLIPALRSGFLVVLCVLLMVLSGCAITRGEVMGRMNAMHADCEAKRRSGTLRNAYEKAQCMNEGLTNIFISIDYPYMDLVNLQNASRLALAEKFDRGEITKAEADVMMADLNQRIATEEQRRVTNDAYARAAQTQATGAFLQGLGVWSQSIRPPVQAPPMTCVQTGAVTQCF